MVILPNSQKSNQIRMKLNPEAYERIGAPDYIIEWVRQGVSIPFQKTPNRCFYQNRIFTKHQVSFMDEQVCKLLNQGVIEVSEVKPHCILAMQCVPKKGGKLRLVMDCRPINENIKTPKFTQEGITAVADMIEPDDVMVTFDLKDGFHQVLIKEEFRKYLGFKWRNKYYVWKYLPFGVACAPYFFNKVIKPVVSFLRENGLRIAPFVDDFLLCIKLMNATDHKDLALAVFQECGWTLNWEQSSLEPSTTKTFVGFVITTENNRPWVSVMPVKIRKLKRTIVRCLHKEVVTKRELARITGQCIAMSKAIIPGKLLLRNCYRVLSTKKSWDDEVTLTEEAKKDLRWWHSAINSWNGAPLGNTAIAAQVETDASSWGWGAAYDNYRASGTWTNQIGFRHSNYRELLAVLMAIESFKEKLKGRHVQILSDNVTTVAYVNRMGGPSKDLSDLMTTIWTSAHRSKIVLSAKFLAGKLNLTADFLSRIDSPYNWTLNRKWFRIIDEKFGPHSIDRFAGEHNAQLKRYNSLYYDPNTEAIDCLAQNNWRSEQNYCAPPFWMIPRVIEKVIQQRATATLIAPLWTGQRWFQKLKQLAVYPPLILPNNRQTFLKWGSRRPEPCKNRRWRIGVWKICGQ